MSQIVKTKRRSMRTKTFMWMLSVLAAVAALLYWEQAAVLFVISTLAVCILLLVVAFADLEGKDRALYNQAETDRAPRTEIDVPKEPSSPVLSNPQAIKGKKVSLGK